MFIIDEQWGGKMIKIQFSFLFNVSFFIGNESERERILDETISNPRFDRSSSRMGSLPDDSRELVIRLLR